MFAIKAIQTLDVYFFSLFLLVLISVKALNNSNAKAPQSRVFSVLIVLIFLIIVADCVTVFFDGRQGPRIRFVLAAASVFGYILQLLVCVAWFWYGRAVVFKDRKLFTPGTILEAVPAVFCVLVTIASSWTGWIFRIDANNNYSRGPLFALIPVASFFYLALGYFMIIWYRKNLEKRHFVALLSFALPPTLGGTVQTVFYGVTLLWPSMTMSILIIYLAIQNELLLLDYLTGINNRRSFDLELRRRVVNARNMRPFALMLVDIDNFRSINDRCGHVECDEALKRFAKLLSYCFYHDGFVCRYGGDEFAVLVELRNLEDMDFIRGRLQSKIDDWNAASTKDWRLSVSLGCAAYLPSDKLTADQFLVKVDRLLSLDKIVPGDRRFKGRKKNAVSWL